MVEGGLTAMIAGSEPLVAHPVAVVLSGYQNDMYDEALVGWRNVTLRPPKVEKQAKRLEVLSLKT
jgi:hypothetical protein